MPTDPVSPATQEATRAAVLARLAAAEAAAREAGALLMGHLGRVKEVVTKSTSKDLVTEVDIASGRLVLRRLIGDFPDDAAVVEEPAILEGLSVAAADKAEFVWVLDPLDGTTSYVHTFPYFSISIALLHRGMPLAGVVYAPLDDECFTAAAGEGSFLNGAKLATSKASSLDEALLITGFAYDRTWPLERQIRILYALMQRIHGVRRSGSAALDLCYVAAGRADGYWELEMKDWDLAAAAVVLREAGGRLTGLDGVDWLPGVADVVASNGPLQEELLATVTVADPGPQRRELGGLLGG